MKHLKLPTIAVFLLILSACGPGLRISGPGGEELPLPTQPPATVYFNKALGLSAGVFAVTATATRVYAGGQFLSSNRTRARRLVAFNNGDVDTNFDSGDGFDVAVQVIAPAQDGTGDIYVGGDFSSYDGASNINRIARLNQNGSIDAGFNFGTGGTAGFDDVVQSIALAADGSGDVYIGGNFTSYNGTANVNRIVRLNSNGSIDTGFNIGAGASAGFNSTVEVILPAADGSGDIYVGGFFTSYNSTSNVNYIVRLNSNGTIDAGFNTGAGPTSGFNNYVRSMVAATDGSGDIYVGGAFSSYNATSDVNYIVRLNSDGSMDTGFDIGSGVSAGFNAGADSLAIAGDGSGDVYAAGNFTAYNGTSNVNRLVRLNSDGSIDSGFNIGSGASAGFNDAVSSIAVAGDGSADLYVGGDFTSYNGTSNVNYLVRLNSDGSIDRGLNVGSGGSSGFAGGIVSSLLDPDDGSGDVYVGGAFTSYNGTSNIRRITRLNSDGSIDSDFDIGSGTSAGFNLSVTGLALAEDGTGDVYVGGRFTSYNSTSNIRYVCRLNSNGSIDTSFSLGAGPWPGFDDDVYSVALDGTGKLYAGGMFYSYDGASDVNQIARLASDGSLDTAFNIGTGGAAGFGGGEVETIAPDPSNNGDVYIGGSFNAYNGSPNVNYIVRLNSDGSMDPGFNTGAGASAGFDNRVRSIVPANDGSGDVYVGGRFTSYNGTSNVNYLVRLNSDGSIDSGFNIGAGVNAGFNDRVEAIALAGDGTGDIYVGGRFTSYNGTPNVNYITRLNSDGSIDTGFNTGSGLSAGFDNWVYSLASARDGSGNVYVGGQFNSYNGITHAYIALLSPLGQSL